MAGGTSSRVKRVKFLPIERESEIDRANFSPSRRVVRFRARPCSRSSLSTHDYIVVLFVLGE